jgi:hypothetical protein
VFVSANPGQAAAWGCRWGNWQGEGAVWGQFEPKRNFKKSLAWIPAAAIVSALVLWKTQPGEAASAENAAKKYFENN